MSWLTTPFCSSDPPALPTIDAARIASWFNPFNPNGSSELRTDMYNLVGHFLWFDLCECVSGAQPSPPPALPYPTDAPVNTPPLTPPPNRASCGQLGSVFETSSFDSSGTITWNTHPTNTVPFYADTAQVLLNGGNPIGVSYPIDHVWTWLDHAGTPIGEPGRATQTADILAASPQSFTFPIPAGAQNVRAQSLKTGATSGTFGTEQSILAYGCGGPGITIEPCCPPDDSLSQMLAQILRDLQELLARGTGAFGYVLGTSHAGLTGSSSLSISSLVGMKATVTAGVPSHLVLEGNPPYQWDLGWMSILTGDGMIEEKRLTRQDQLWFPALMPNATTFGYFLFPGVTVTFTELQRG